MKRTFYVKALWDEEVKVWYSETDIEGLFINAKDLDEFEDVVAEFAGELVMENHWKVSKISDSTLSSAVPIIILQIPHLTQQAA